MKSFILHGEDQSLSRKRLVEIIGEAKKNGWDIVRIDWNASKTQDLLTTARSANMLSLGQLIVIENFFANNKKASEIVKELIKDEVTSFVFWEGKSINGNTLRSFAKTFIIQEFKIPLSIFNFLNSVYPGNTVNALRQLKLVSQNGSADFLLIMLSRHVRQLIWVKEDPDSLKIQDWQKRNLLAQSSKYTSEHLISLHAKILELDRLNKKSQLPENLFSSLDLVIASV